MRGVAIGLFVCWSAACGGGNPCADDSPECTGQFCNSDSDCGASFECDPVNKKCYPKGWIASDAGTHTPDAAIDAPPPPPPPDTILVMKPPASTQSGTGTFTFTSDQSPTDFECKLDAGAFAACTSPKTYDDLAEGSHTFAVRAKKGTVVDDSPAMYMWKVDRTAPDTTITSGPSGDIDTSEAAFAFTCDDSPCTFECKMDGGAFASCKPNDSFGGLTLGSHTFQVRAIDAAGNVDQSPDSRTFNVKTVTPETTITAGPGAITNKTDVSFSFVCIEEGVEVACTFVCSLDGAAATACTSPQAYTGLAPGAHAFTVKGTDANGKADPTATIYPFTIDVTKPVVTIVTKPGPVSGPSASFTYTASEAISLYECAIDGAFAPCTADGVSFDPLKDGSRTFAVRGTDLAGNVSDPATFTWTVDAVGPVVTVTFPLTESGPSGMLTFTFIDLSPPVTFRCDFGKGFVPCDTGFMFTGLANGENTVTIEGTDKWKNVSTTVQTFTVDAIGPLVSIIAPQEGSLTPGSGAASFTVAADAVRFTCTVDGSPVTPCAAGQFLFDGLLTGSHTMVVTAFDKWDNASASPATVTWNVDADPPVVIIDTPTNLQVVCPTISVTFHAALKPDGSPDNLVRFSCALDNESFVPCISGVTYNLTSQGNPHIVRVIATDEVGNQSPIPSAQVMFTVDDFPPEGTVTPHSPPAGLPDEIVCKDGFITWSATDDNHPTTGGSPTYVTGTCDVDTDIACTTNNAMGTNMLGFADLGNGGHTLTLTVEDACHNRQILSNDFDVDRAGPTVQINTPGQAAVCFGTGPINYDFDDAAPSSGNVTLVTGGATVDSTTCAGTTCDFLGGGTGGLEYINLADGGHSISVTLHDRCDNQTTANATFTVDLTPPVISLADGSFELTTGPVNTGTASFTFDLGSVDASGVASVQAGQVFGPPDDAGNFPDPSDTSQCTCAMTSTTTGGCTQCSGLAAGVNYLKVRATDACGRTSSYVMVQTHPIEGTQVDYPTATFGPNSGHAVVIGHSYVDPATPPNLIGNAPTLAPFIHQDLGINRNLRILGWTGQLATGGPTAPADPALANARATMLGWLHSEFAIDPTYVEFADAAGSVAPLSNNLPGYDVLVVYDQHLVFDTQEPDTFLSEVGDAWNGPGTLLNFLNAGGVVVVLAGSIDGSESSTASGNQLLLNLGSQTPPMRVLLTAPLSALNSFSDARASYPFPSPIPLAGQRPYWMIFPPISGASLFGYDLTDGESTLGGTQVFVSGVLSDQEPIWLLEPSVVSLYEVLGNILSCGGVACFILNLQLPLVLDQTFPGYTVQAAINPGPTGDAPASGTGFFEVDPGVTAKGFTCYLHPFPDTQGKGPDHRSACTITAFNTDNGQIFGTFSYQVNPTFQSPAWQVHITLLDDHNDTRFPNGEPAVGSVTFATDFSIAGTATPHDFPTETVDWTSTTDTLLADVACVTLYGFVDPGTDPGMCGPNFACIDHIDRSGAGCGAVAATGPFIEGSGTADFKADADALGICLTFRTVIAIADGFGNVTTLDSGTWFNDCSIGKPTP